MTAGQGKCTEMIAVTGTLFAFVFHCMNVASIWRVLAQNQFHTPNAAGSSSEVDDGYSAGDGSLPC
jgi:hypothetical protein